MTDYVEDGKNGLIFESGNTNQLADKLLDLLTHPDKRRCLADSGYQTVQSFSWQAVAINIMDIFRQI